MASPSGERNPVEQLAGEFAERFRRGERPSLTEYTDKYPELAEEIRELFPALVAMERLKPARGDLTGAYGGNRDEESPRPRQLGDYRLVREVGRGGMGVVYEAVQESLGRHVALKVLPAHALDNPVHLERFRREARAAARLHHTNIVPVYGVGETDGVHHYAMQFIPGEGLDKVLRDLRHLHDGKCPLTAATTPATVAASGVAHGLLTGQFARPDAAANGSTAVPAAEVPAAGLSLGEGEPSGSSLSGTQPGWQYCQAVARVGVQVAEALGYAHKQGILHRDIKPSNLLLDRQGTVWVTDFGLAKAEDGGDLTNTGEIVGTLRFMAPERFNGKSLPQGDVYGLGLTLYEMLTLRPAYEEGDRMGLIDLLLHEMPVPPRQLKAHIPRDLETIVWKCLAKDPAERYASAEALAEDLRRFLADRPIHARRADLGERLWRWARRNPAVAALLGCVAGLLLTVAIVSTFAALRLDRALVQTRQAEREARLREAEALVSQAHGTRYSRQVGQRFETLAALEKAAAIGRELGQPPEWFDRLRNEAIACLALPDLRVLREWDGLPAGTTGWTSDARHRLYARKDHQGHISVRRVDTDEEITQIDGPAGSTSFDLSPDGRFLMVNGQGQDRTWDLGSSPPVLIAEPKSIACGQTFQPDSRHKIITRADGSIFLYDLTSPRQAPKVLAKFDNGRVTSPTFDPHGTKLAVAAANGRAVHILDARSGKDLSTPWLQKVPVSCLAWHPAGKFLAAASNAPDSRIYIWDITRGQQAIVLEGCRNGGISIAFTPDGEFVVSTGWENKVRFWRWRTGEQVLSQGAISNLRFGPDGRPIISEGNRLKLAEVAVGKEYRSLVQQSSPGKDVAYERGALHPAGRLLAVHLIDGVRLWDLETGDELARIGPSQVAFTSDSMLTNGPTGLLLWPIHHAPQPGTAWRIGPPRLLRGGTSYEVACSRGGQVIVQAASNGAFVLHRDRPERPIRLRSQGGVRRASISPDGRFVATGTHGDEGGLKIWETEHGRPVKELRLSGIAHAAFSPDGKWLAVQGTGSGRILTVGTWEEGPAIPSGGEAGVAFSPDGNLLAVETGHGVVRLLDPATGLDKARLEDPHQDIAKWLGFTPDGTRLIAVSDDGKAIHVWDLKRIRAELARLGLDWDAPPYPERADPAPGPLAVRVVGAELPAQLQKAARGQGGAELGGLSPPPA
jgi:serine/threonine protein kinase/WD40 repeat protein